MKLKKELITQRDSKSPISEIFRTLRTNIQFMSTNKKMKTLLITSTVPGEGKSWVASNLAVTFAQAGNKVILIDADMRKGRQYSIFRVQPRPGLSNFLTEIADKDFDGEDIKKYIRETEIENLVLMPTGKIPPNPSELLVAPQMAKLLKKLKEGFDIIIIDGTPCELVTDSVILSSVADSTLIVTAYKSTRKDSLERIIKNIQNVGGNLVGVVVNKMPMSAKKYYGNYYASTDNPSLMEQSKTEINDNRNINANKNKCVGTNSKKVTKTRKTTKKTSIETSNKKANIKKNKNNDIKQSTEKRHSEVHIKKNEDLEKPSFLKNEENKGKTSDRTKDILDQMNLYYNNEKKK